MMAFGFNWIEKLPGHGHMQSQISGSVSENGDAQSRTLLQTTARFKVENSWCKAREEFRTAHDAIGVSFKNIVHKEFRPK
jgi:hypothetical protein